MNNQCQCFIGYEDDSWATYEDFHSTYIACETYGINQFLAADVTTMQAFNEMMDYFEEQIELLINMPNNNDEVLVAMELQHNMFCFIIDGDRTLTRANFHT